MQGREAFAAVLDVRMCRRDVLPMDGSAYRRLDRVSAVVVDGATLCTGPPVVVEVGLEPAAEAGRVGRRRRLDRGVAAARVGGRRGGAGAPAAGPGAAPTRTPRRPGARRPRQPRASGSARSSSPTSSTRTPRPCCAPSTEAGHRLVLTAHAGTADVAGLADEVAEPRREPAGDRPPGAGPGLRGAPRRVRRGQRGPAGARRRGPAPRTPGPRCSPRTSPSPRSFPVGHRRGAPTW